MRKVVSLLIFVACAFALSGCLSHWVLESESRLQVENATSDCTLLAVDVVSEDGSHYKSWIRETLEPGERSHVVAGDWVGEFTLRITYTNSPEAAGDTLTDLYETELDGGSLYLKVGGKAKSLTYKFK